MTTTGTNAARTLAARRKTYVITCEVCGETATKRDSRARICGSAHCTYVQRKLRERVGKEAQ